MKLSKSFLKQIIKEELQNLQEADKGVEMEIDMGTLFSGNMVRVTVSESATDNRNIRIISINGNDVKHFADAVIQEVPFEIQINNLGRDEQRNLNAAINRQKKGERDDFAADQADSSY